MPKALKTLFTFTVLASLLVVQTSISAYSQNKSWRAYSPPNKSFSVELPAPLRRVSSFDGEHGVSLDPSQREKGSLSYTAVEAVPDDSRFGIIVLNGGLKSLGKQRREKFIEYLSWLIIGDDDELQFMRPPAKVKHNGLIGNEYLYIRDVTINRSLFTRGRIFDIGNRVYVLVFIGRDTKDLTSPDANRFFSSFRLRRNKRI